MKLTIVVVAIAFDAIIVIAITSLLGDEETLRLHSDDIRKCSSSRIAVESGAID